MLCHFKEEMDKQARLLNIQKLQSINPDDKEYRLVTLIALKMAGERHNDLKGNDPNMYERRLQRTARR